MPDPDDGGGGRIVAPAPSTQAREGYSASIQGFADAVALYAAQAFQMHHLATKRMASFFGSPFMETQLEEILHNLERNKIATFKFDGTDVLKDHSYVLFDQSLNNHNTYIVKFGRLYNGLPYSLGHDGTRWIMISDTTRAPTNDPNIRCPSCNDVLESLKKALATVNANRQSNPIQLRILKGDNLIQLSDL